jgi:hypothetical protein
VTSLLHARGVLVRIAALGALDPAEPAARSVAAGLAQALADDLQGFSVAQDPTCWFDAPRVGGWAPGLPPEIRAHLRGLAARLGPGVGIPGGVDARAVEAGFGARRVGRGGSFPVLDTAARRPPRRGPLATARRALVRALPRTLEPWPEAIPTALAELLAGADDTGLLALLSAPWKDEDATRRGAVQSALAGALTARQTGCDEGAVLDVALASLTASLLPPRSLGADTLAPLVAAHWRAHPPQPGLDARMALVLALPDDDGAEPTQAGLIRLALAWQQLRALGEPEQLATRLRELPGLHAGARETLLERMSGACVGATWLLADGSVGVVVDDAPPVPLVRLLADAHGRRVPAAFDARPAREEAALHAPVDASALALDPTDALFVDPEPFPATPPRGGTGGPT